MFRNFFGQKGAMCRLHDQVTVPATTIVSKLQGLASAYRLDMERERINEEYVLRSEPSLRRVKVDSSKIVMRKEPWLVSLDHGCGSRSSNGD